MKPVRARLAGGLLIGLVLAAGAVATPAPASAESPAAPETTLSASAPPTLLPPATARDVEARGRLFDRGIPVTDGSFSPDGFHFAYIHSILGGFLQRKPRRCTFLLDMGTGENQPVKTPKGRAARIGGWDSTGRYLLIESQDPDLLTALTGGWTTYHWIFDIVTWEFVPRKPFTGRRDDRRFLWKQRGTYHGLWSEDEEGVVIPLYEGELADIYHAREEALDREDERRRRLAERLALGSDAEPRQVLSEALPRLDDHWTRRSQRDPVVADLFGDRPALFVQRDGEWVRGFDEVDYVAVLDRGLVLVTAPHARQYVLNVERWEALALPEAPPGWSEMLDERWNRNEGFYDESDPLPRDLQYRRSSDIAQGTSMYFNYVLPDRSRVLVLYSFDAGQRVLRIVDLPPGWRREPSTN